MPEMPEVEIIRRYLDKNLAGKTITAVDVLLPRQLQGITAEEFTARASGVMIKSVGRVGKYLLLHLDSSDDIVFHLRMTGRLVYAPDGVNDDKCARLIFSLAGGARLIYGDTRTLGVIYMTSTTAPVKGVAEMGPEPLSAAFTPEYLKGVLAKKKTRIKTLLLNQKYIGGIGNIYADEALFLARINPFTHAQDIDAAGAARLQAAINEVIAAGINDGGTTFRDYQNGEGKKGHHQEHLFVYGRTGESCRECGAPIEKTFLGGRGTHFCPHCQPMSE